MYLGLLFLFPGFYDLFNSWCCFSGFVRSFLCYWMLFLLCCFLLYMAFYLIALIPTF